MIQSIEIENFRCFEKTSIKGFGRLNLIGGKNNAGKTALLEAILLSQIPQAQAINFIQGLRHEGEKFQQKNPEKAWDFLFNIGAPEKPIEIKYSIENEKNTISISKERISNVEEYFSFLDNEKDDDAKEFKNSIINSDTKKTILRIDEYQNSKKIASSSIFLDKVGSVIKNNPNINKKSKKDLPIKRREVGFLSSKDITDQEKLASNFDEAFEKKLYEEIINGIHIIDPSIKEARTNVAGGSSRIMLCREDNNYIPLSLFGDAISKLMDIILSFVNSDSNTIWLIDEIENGIHHSNQESFWVFISKLAIKFNIQVFSTTHSAEMIAAFNKTSMTEDFKNIEMNYIEMATNSKNKIIGISMSPETLNYKVAANKSYRGE